MSLPLAVHLKSQLEGSRSGTFNVLDPRQRVSQTSVLDSCSPLPPLLPPPPPHAPGHAEPGSGGSSLAFPV